MPAPEQRDRPLDASPGRPVLDRSVCCLGNSGQVSRELAMAVFVERATFLGLRMASRTFYFTSLGDSCVLKVLKPTTGRGEGNEVAKMAWCNPRSPSACPCIQPGRLCAVEHHFCG